MDTVVWVMRVVLALAFLAAGGTKLSRSKDQLRERMAWVDDFSAQMVKAIGAAEVVGAIGLLIPALTPFAAAGLVVLMAGAVVTHVRRKEVPMALPALILLALSAALTVGSA